MTGIRTTTFATAVLGVGLVLGACASPAAKKSAPVVPSAALATSVAPAAQVTASAPATPTVQSVPVQDVPVQDVPVVQVAPASTPAVAPTASTPPSATTPPSVPSPSAAPVDAGAIPHFTTPDDAMRYLVAAYNSHDIAAEMHVTTPESRAALETERQWVNTFSFHSCTVNPGGGDYSCQFDMVSKVKTTDEGTDSFGDDVQQMGEITVLVAPAQRPGWYMYYNEGCGGG
jgi:hypothetical protein